MAIFRLLDDMALLMPMFLHNSVPIHGTERSPIGVVADGVAYRGVILH